MINACYADLSVRTCQVSVIFSLVKKEFTIKDTKQSMNKET